MASGGGIGTPSHVSGDLFKMMTGVNMVHVPYRGAAPAMTDLIAGQVIYFTTASIEYIRARQELRPRARGSVRMRCGHAGGPDRR